MNLLQQRLWEWGAGLDERVPINEADVGGMLLAEHEQKAAHPKSDSFLPDQLSAKRRYASGIFWGHGKNFIGASRNQPVHR